MSLLTSPCLSPPADGGSYSCRGSNGEGWAQAVVDIAVLQGEIRPECRDIPGLANCRLVVKRRVGNHIIHYYFCSHHHIIHHHKKKNTRSRSWSRL